MTDEMRTDSTNGGAVRDSAPPDMPAYGRMASEFPDWDPYVYGKPEQEQQPKPQVNNSPVMRMPVVAIGSHNENAGQNQNGTPQADAAGHSDTQSNQAPQFYDRNGDPVNFPMHIEDFDPDDPRKNPVYGRWDVMAIVAFFLALFDYTAVLGLIFGIFSMIRTRKLHMKGFVFALLAVILSVVSLALLAYLIYTGTSSQEFIEQMRQWAENTIR